MPPIIQIGRSLCGVVLGYIVFVAGAWVAQEAILGGVSYADGWATILLAGILTPPSAVIGAALTVAIAGFRPLLHILPMCLLIVAETTYLYSTGRVDGPLWFEAMAGASLIIGAIVGALGWRWMFEKPHASSQTLQV